MATDYDAPRKSLEDEADSIEALKERIPESAGAQMDVEDIDNPDYSLGDTDLTNMELDVVVLPQQEDEFTCTSCFLVRHHTQHDHDGEFGPVCAECSL